MRSRIKAVHHTLGAVAIAVLLPVAWLGAADRIAPPRQAQLKHLLLQDCGSCHGMTLKGGLGSPLLPANLAGKPDELLLDTILNGRPGTAMPPWHTQLSVEEAQWLVDLLRKGVGDATR